VGRDLTVEQGQEAARYAALNCLALLKAYLGSLDKIRRFVQVVGYVRSAEDFGDQPQVMNGASSLILDLFGERGAHTRLALGTSELPGGAPVEVTFIVEV
jgi:enamine deaminase RidA (YjgF/YER057c/UK114 family)